MTNRERTLQQIAHQRVSAIVRTTDAGLAADAMKAAVDGGIRIVEFTLTTPDALRLIGQFARNERLLVGAGTVLTVEQARAAVEAGARFLVSPVCDPQVIRAARELDAVSVPGTFTPTEMQTAHHAGADLVKLFPSPGNVADTVASILGPLPHLRIFPTAGVDVNNFLSVLRAGAIGVGFVRSLFVPSDMAERNFAAITQRAARIVSILAECPAPVADA